MVLKLVTADIASLMKPSEGAVAGTELLLDFVEFVDSGSAGSLGELLHRVLFKARRLVDAEAGSIFVMRGRGNNRYLEAGSLQNDAIDLTTERIVLRPTRQSIAGYVALTGRTLFIDDLYAINKEQSFAFNSDVDKHTGYLSRTMLAFPLVNASGSVVAVVQLINRKPAGSELP